MLLIVALEEVGNLCKFEACQDYRVGLPLQLNLSGNTFKDTAKDVSSV